VPVSQYFNNQASIEEQFLIEDLVIESIRNHGIDILYIPRDSRSSLDELFGDDPVKSFTQAYKIDMYMDTFNDFEGNQEFFSKFGLEIQKTARLTVARRTFEKLVPSVLRNVPKEGDLIYLPVQQKLMEIRFVEEEKNFFQLGKSLPYMFVLSVETFKYNGELIDTGYTEIDAVGDSRGFGVEYTLGVGGSGTYQKHEIVFQGNALSNATAKGYVSDWNAVTRTLRIRNIKGSIASNVALKGASSNSNWTISSGDMMEDATDLYRDNTRIENEAENILDFSENNPWGEP
jgi:hypothetical protein